MNLSRIEQLVAQLVLVLLGLLNARTFPSAQYSHPGNSFITRAASFKATLDEILLPLMSVRGLPQLSDYLLDLFVRSRAVIHLRYLP